MSEPEEWTPEGLVDHFWRIDRKMLDRRFCFILGAGASVQSGIPAAGTLVRRWLGELHQRLDRRRQPLEQWATASTLGIPGFSLDQAATYYSQVFERRFRQSPDEGYADLEDIMQGKDPSFGYSVLAHILAETRHKLVITTNFDNLVTDALSIFTATSPLVCGHESLAAFIRVAPRRPVVVKIHRDLLMAPMNRAEEIATLQNSWVEPLTRVFAAYTPIVLGYGGNDGSLMGFLNDLPAGAIVGGLYWCYYGPGGPPGREICDLVAKHDGALVPIDGFDELMLRLTARLGIPLLDQVIETKARTRVESYRRRIDELRARNTPAEPDSSDTSSTSLPLESPAASDTSSTSLSLESHVSSDMSGTALSLAPSASASATPLPSEPPVSSGTSETPPPPGHTSPGTSSTSPRKPDVSSNMSETTLPSGHDPPDSHDRDTTLSARSPHERGRPRDASLSAPLERGTPRDPSPAPPVARSSESAPTPPPPVPTRVGPTHSASPLGPSTTRSSSPLASSPTRRSTEPPPTRSASPAAPSPTRSAGPLPSDAPQPTEEDEHASFDIDLSADDAPRTRGQTLEQVLQQVAAETAETSPLAALTQARLERRHEGRLQALRAASARFPRDVELRHALAEELSAAPDAASHGEATSILESLLADNTDDARAMRHLALLHAWNRRFGPAAALLRRISQSVSFILDPVDAAHLTFIAGLLARLSERDDTRFLALLKSAVYRAAPRSGLPEGLVRHLLDRLDRPSRRTYVRLLSMFVDGTAPHRVELVEPRFAAVPAADLATLSPDDFTWPQGQAT